MSSAIETRERILDATRALLEEGEAATMGQIASRAGVTRQLVHLRFAGRAELLLELSRRIDAEVRTPERQAAVDLAADGVEALRAAVALQGHIKPRIEAVARAIDLLRAHDPDAAAAWREREDARHERAADVVRCLRDEGRLAAVWTAPAASRLLWSTTSQRAWRELVVEAGWPTRRWVRETTALLERALLRPS